MVRTRSFIEIDRMTGRRSGSAAAENLGLSAMTLAARMLAPFHEYGFSYAARAVARALPSSKSVRLRFPDRTSFDFPYGDPYWSTLLRAGRVYERGIEFLLGEIADEDFVFVDCGANYGYWSARISGPQFGSHAAIAIEAAPDTFEWLRRNCTANGDRFAILNRAISASSGERVSLFGAKHEARSVVSSGGAAVGEVETISLDRLLDRDELRSAARIVLKLDVEGAELEALRGGARMLERDVLLIYEDHGSDRSHAVTRHVKAEAGMRVFAATGHNVWEVRDLGELDAVKVSRRWGYDFFATRSPFWITRMESLMSSPPPGRH